MNKFNFLKTFVILTMVGIGVSCGGDDDNTTDKDIAFPIQEELRPFIGLWKIKTNNRTSTYPDYEGMFFQDKVCKISQYYKSSDNSHSNYCLTWNYDETTKILSIAGESKAQWQITAVSDINWSGLSLWTSSQIGYAATKDTVIQHYLKYLMTETTWTCDSVKLRYSDSGKSGPIIQLDKVVFQDSDGTKWSHGHYGEKEIDKLDFNEQKDILRLEKQSYHSTWQIRFHTIYELHHPYCYNSMYMDIFYEISEREQIRGSYTGRFLPGWRQNKKENINK